VGELSTQEGALAATEATVTQQTRGGLWQRWLSAVGVRRWGRTGFSFIQAGSS